MDHYDFVPGRAGRSQLRRQVVAGLRSVQEGAAQFDQEFQSSPSLSACPSIRFIFWIAWPAAPFTRLSMALTTTARPVAASNFKPISQKFVRWTAFKSGNSPGL